MSTPSATTAPTPICPRCGYDVSGPIATWDNACPVEGRCPECGLDFRWVDVLHPDRLLLPWLYFHTRKPWWRGWRALAHTVVRSALPLYFWRTMKLSHAVKRPRLIAYVGLPLVMLHIVLAIGFGVEGQVNDWAHRRYYQRIVAEAAQGTMPTMTPAGDRMGSWQLAPDQSRFWWEPWERTPVLVGFTPRDARSRPSPMRVPYADLQFIWVFETDEAPDEIEQALAARAPGAEVQAPPGEITGQWVAVSGLDRRGGWVLGPTMRFVPGRGLKPLGPKVTPTWDWRAALDALINPYAKATPSGFTRTNPLIAFAAVSGFAAGLASCCMFVVLPWTLTRAKTRATHIVRAGVVIGSAPLWLALLWAGGLLAALMVADVWLALSYSEMREDLLLFHGRWRDAANVVLVLALMAWQLVAWVAVCKRYLRIAHPYAAAAAVWLNGWLVAWALLAWGVVSLAVDGLGFAEQVVNWVVW